MSNSQLQPFDYLAEAAAGHPDGLFYADQAQTISFAEALKLSKQIAGQMRELGVKAGQKVALRLPTGLQVLFIEALFHEGAISMPYVSYHEGEDRLVADWLFSTQDVRSDNAKRTAYVDGLFLGKVNKQSVNIEPAKFESPKSICRIVFSSGTTGTPKPIAFSFEMVEHRANAAFELFNTDAPFMSLLDLSSASGFHTFYASVKNQVAYLNPGNASYNASELRARGVSAIKASPVQLGQLANELLRSGEKLPELTHIYSAGSALPVATRKLLGQVTGAKLFNLYGSSEVGRAAERELNDEDLSFAGLVVEGTELEVVDENDRVLPFGEEGLIRYRHQFMATEYLDDPVATANGFKHGWFYTGDLGTLSASGEVRLTGRSSEIINAGGLKIDPARIESAALDFDGVVDAAGFAHVGVAGPEFALAVVAGSDFDSAKFTKQLKKDFGAMAPRLVVMVKEIPRNNMGKVLRRELAANFAAASKN